MTNFRNVYRSNNNAESGFSNSGRKIMNIIGNFKIIIIALSITSILSYLVVVNRTNTMGYEIAEMQLKIKNLKETHRDLESKSTELQSMQRIKQLSSSVLNMVEADSYSYVSAMQGTVTAKK